MRRARKRLRVSEKSRPIVSDSELLKIVIPVILSVIASVLVTAWRFGIKLAVLETQQAHLITKIAELSATITMMQASSMRALEARASRPDA